MKNKVVVFTKNNARVLTNFELPKKINPRAKVLVNPDLSLLKRIPTHFWKLDCGAIKEMTPKEKRQRMRDIKLYGSDNNWQRVLAPPKVNYWKIAPYVFIIGLSMAIGHLTARWFHG